MIARFVYLVRHPKFLHGWISGGQFESDRGMDDLKQLYRIYLTEAFSGGKLEDDKVHTLDLQHKNTVYDYPL